VSKKCYATLGQVGNVDSINITLGKAGRSRWLGKKPKVRVVKNPIDHHTVEGKVVHQLVEQNL